MFWIVRTVEITPVFIADSNGAHALLRISH